MGGGSSPCRLNIVMSVMSAMDDGIVYRPNPNMYPLKLLSKVTVSSYFFNHQPHIGNCSLSIPDG